MTFVYPPPTRLLFYLASIVATQFNRLGGLCNRVSGWRSLLGPQAALLLVLPAFLCVGAPMESVCANPLSEDTYHSFASVLP